MLEETKLTPSATSRLTFSHKPIYKKNIYHLVLVEESGDS